MFRTIMYTPTVTDTHYMLNWVLFVDLSFSPLPATTVSGEYS